MRGKLKKSYYKSREMYDPDWTCECGSNYKVKSGQHGFRCSRCRKTIPNPLCAKCGEKPKYKSQPHCRECWQELLSKWSVEIQDKPCAKCGAIDRNEQGSCNPCRRKRGRERNRLKDRSHLLCSRCKKRPRVDGKCCEKCLERIANGSPMAMERPKEYIKDWTLKERYGVSLKQFEEMAAAQNGLCYICKDPERSGLNQEWLSVDHDHSDGRVRKILCRKCNSGLGMFGDDPERIARAVEYLNEFREVLK